MDYHPPRLKQSIIQVVGNLLRHGADYSPQENSSSRDLAGRPPASGMAKARFSEKAIKAVGPEVRGFDFPVTLRLLIDSATLNTSYHLLAFPGLLRFHGGHRAGSWAGFCTGFSCQGLGRFGEGAGKVLPQRVNCDCDGKGNQSDHQGIFDCRCPILFSPEG